MPLSREELRAKRLETFLGEVPKDSRKADVIDICSSEDDSNEEDLEHKKLPTSRMHKGRTKMAKCASTPSDSSLTSSANVPDTHPDLFRSSFQVATWNVWFGPHNGDNPHVKARMTALANVLREPLSGESERNASASVAPPPCPPLWFLGFQEVTAESERTLVEKLRDYRFIVQENRCSYYCMLGVRQQQSSSRIASPADDPTILDSRWIDYSASPAGQRRGFCYARVRLPVDTIRHHKNHDQKHHLAGMSGQEVLVATTHLESWCGPTYTGVVQRQAQLLQFEEFAREQLQQHSPRLQCCILMGDLNWDDEGKSPKDSTFDKILTALPFVDAGQSTFSKSSDCPGYTYDGKLNPMLSNRIRKRFDRVLVFIRSSSSSPNSSLSSSCLSMPCVMARTQLLGKDALPGLTWKKITVNPFQKGAKQSSRLMPVAISDHFGVRTTLSFGDRCRSGDLPINS